VGEGGGEGGKEGGRVGGVLTNDMKGDLASLELPFFSTQRSVMYIHVCGLKKTAAESQDDGDISFPPSLSSSLPPSLSPSNLSHLSMRGRNRYWFHFANWARRPRIDPMRRGKL